MIENCKKCSMCKKVKHTKEFYFRNKTKGWLQSRCITCKIIKQKEYRRDNAEKINEYHKKYVRKRVKADPIFKIKRTVRNEISNAFRYLNKSKRSEQLLGCTLGEFVKYIEGMLKPGMTLENHGKWHLDHIIPLASASTKEEIEKLCHYKNYQPLWALDNKIKSDRIINYEN
jgi:hypothetical protein